MATGAGACADVDAGGGAFLVEVRTVSPRAERRFGRAEDGNSAPTENGPIDLSSQNTDKCQLSVQLVAFPVRQIASRHVRLCIFELFLLFVDFNYRREAGI